MKDIEKYSAYKNDDGSIATDSSTPPKIVDMEEKEGIIKKFSKAFGSYENEMIRNLAESAYEIHISILLSSNISFAEWLYKNTWSVTGGSEYGLLWHQHTTGKEVLTSELVGIYLSHPVTKEEDDQTYKTKRDAFEGGRLFERLLVKPEPSEPFETALQQELDKLPYTKHLDDGGFNDGQLAGFERGARWGRCFQNKEPK